MADAHVEVVRRVVREAEEQVARQIEHIEQMRVRAENTERAEALLGLLQDLLRLAGQHLEFVEGAAKTRDDRGLI